MIGRLHLASSGCPLADSESSWIVDIDSKSVVLDDMNRGWGLVDGIWSHTDRRFKGVDDGGEEEEE